jgi:hypothetical protein
MKRFFKIVIAAVIVMLFFGSCERRCVCTYLEDGSQEIIYSAYSKKECQEWDDYYNNSLNISVDCTYKRY